MRVYLRKIINKVKDVLLYKVYLNNEGQRLLSGKILSNQVKGLKNINTLDDVEFSIFSQFGEDGIIQYLIHNLPIKNKFFIEFGVENYNESNTRFLLMNNNWKGIVIDGSNANINYIKSREYFWRYSLTAINSFITKENIDTLLSNELKQLNIDENIGILSVDIDGVDYWVLNEIMCVDPAIIICEYNSLFGNDTPLTVPYDKGFERTKYHYSNLYWGANLKAYTELLLRRGYLYIGSNSQNFNAFFVKKELAEKYLPNLLTNIKAFEVSSVRQSKDENGNLTHLSYVESLKKIENLELLDIDKNKMIKIKELI